jgi:hypothetical protein
MKTYPDFMWEWIVESCESFCNQIQNYDGHEPVDLPERLRGYIQTAQGIIAIVPKLREHPQLEKLVPMKSLMSLRWFPSKEYEVQLYYEENKDQYSITIIKRGSDLLAQEVVEKEWVAFDEVANELYTYITALRDD